MRKRFPAVLLCLLAATVLSFGRKEETTEQLIARANAARPEQQPDLFMQVAAREMKAAEEAGKANQSEPLHTALGQIVKYSDSAHSAAMRTDKRIKRTEIKIREISNKLRGMKLNVDVDDQPAVQDAIDKLEQFRNELFQSMFGSKSKD